MTLKENFDKISCKNCDMPWCDVGCTILSSSELDRLEKIADDFAIGFLNWYAMYGSWIEENLTSTELLKIYKEETKL